jgi:uncharacterized OB-fold protein
LTQTALAPEVSNWPDENPQLIGSQCGDCGATAFPRQARCPRCSGGNVADAFLPRRGKVITWTTQGFLPHPGFAGGQTAETFKPFAMGLVQLGDVIRVEGRLTESDPAKLSFGMDVELTFIPFFVDQDGSEVMMYAFSPVEGEST